MRLIYLIIVFGLIAGLGFLLYSREPGASPTGLLDKLVEPRGAKTPPPAAAVYRWRDAEGVWQFGDSPPDQQSAEALDIRPNITPIKADWVAQLEAIAKATGAPLPDRPAGAPAPDGDGLAAPADSAGGDKSIEEYMLELQTLIEQVRN